jgi:hypothetical protein
VQRSNIRKAAFQLRWSISFPDEGPVPRLHEWACTADREKLIRVAQAISGEGARVVPGRSRGPGKRSAPRVEPMIRGEVRGDGAARDHGGRPRNDALQDLILQLAGEWLYATGELPKAGRSDKTGFGDLVHKVFQWCGEPEAATHALRQYWAERPGPRTS